MKEDVNWAALLLALPVIFFILLNSILVLKLVVNRNIK
eukprot:CAMPEP_0116895548 /NCGR_PEP_ID=MMETSP0467-20121206/5050_1 /TAXON_ID=283647 /ORGANISM="Mesodinium pulex, Strain SPMC105" /LENGTH=37 /DNA_ID= /DNA_START= /DNA_END= /DNA_ORIENTATION=